MAAQNTSVLITACTYGGTAFGIAQSVTFSQPVTPIGVSAQGDLGTTKLGIVAKGGVATVTWIAGAGSSPWDPDGSTATLSMIAQDLVGGASQTFSWTNMSPLDWTLNFSDRSVNSYTQNFVNVSAAADGFTPALA